MTPHGGEPEADCPTPPPARSAGASLVRAVAEIQAFVASLPVRDSRSADEILGYDEFGLPR